MQFIKIPIILYCRVPIMNKFISVHWILLITIEQNQWKFQRNPQIWSVRYVVIMLLDSITMFCHVHHVKLSSVGMSTMTWFVFFLRLILIWIFFSGYDSMFNRSKSMLRITSSTSKMSKMPFETMSDHRNEKRFHVDGRRKTTKKTTTWTKTKSNIHFHINQNRSCK